MTLPPRRAALIWNPTAGGSGSQNQRATQTAKFCAALEQRGGVVEAWPTTCAGDAQRLAARAVSEGITEVYVAGGDGTINEAVQALAGTSTRLGLWPQGTANVLAREIKLPFALPRLVEVLAQGRTQPLYLGAATLEQTQERRYFFLMAGIGLDASVVRHVNPKLKKRIGKGAFWLAGLGHLAHWQPQPFTVEIDGAEYPATFAAIGKASRYGSNLAVTPRARLDAPEFEICLVNAANPFRFLRFLPYLKRSGVPEKFSDVRFFRATRARAWGENMDAQVDGEYLGQLPMAFDIVPQPLALIVP